MTREQWAVYLAFREGFVAWPELRLRTRERSRGLYVVTGEAVTPAGTVLGFQGEVPRLALFEDDPDAPWLLERIVADVVRDFREVWRDDERRAQGVATAMGQRETEAVLPGLAASLREAAEREAARLHDPFRRRGRRVR